MSLKRKLEGEVEIKEGAADVHHDIWKSKPHNVSHAAPHFIQGCDLHQGEPGQAGSIFIFNYSLGGKPLIAKNLIEAIDEENKSVSIRTIEGDLMNDYKTIVGTCKVIPKDSETSIVRWTFEYEKLSPDKPEPSALVDALLSAAKDIDDHHHGLKK